MPLTVEHIGILRSKHQPAANRFYGMPLERTLPKAWRITVDDSGSLRTGFHRQVDAEMAKAALERAGLDSTETIVAAGWKTVERVMLESLQW